MLLGAIVVATAACSTPPPSTSVASDTPSPSAVTSAGAKTAPKLDQAWATAILTDVTTGRTFRIADLVATGRVVFVETMAIWCSNCRAQQEEATVAFEELNPDRVVWVAIDVESSETAQALASYRDQNGFPFTYVIADKNLARALAADLGDTVLSPPSVNVIVIGTDGRVTHLRGHRTAAELRGLAAEHGA